jgi:hypothetical protein
LGISPPTGPGYTDIQEYYNIGNNQESALAPIKEKSKETDRVKPIRIFQEM